MSPEIKYRKPLSQKIQENLCIALIKHEQIRYFYQANTGLWNLMASYGGHYIHRQLAADTWEDCVNVSGTGGYLTHFCGAAFSVTQSYELEIIIDGEKYYFNRQQSDPFVSSIKYRHMFGRTVLIDAAFGSIVTTYFPKYYSEGSRSLGTPYNIVDGTNTAVDIPTFFDAQSSMAMGLPFVRFENSLIIRQKLPQIEDVEIHQNDSVISYCLDY